MQFFKRNKISGNTQRTWSGEKLTHFELPDGIRWEQSTYGGEVLNYHRLRDKSPHYYGNLMIDRTVEEGFVNYNHIVVHIAISSVKLMGKYILRLDVDNDVVWRSNESGLQGLLNMRNYGLFRAVKNILK